MATSINGFGRAFYGKRDFDQDGSYITTKWLIFGFFPISPAESLRVRPISGGIFGGEYEVLEELPVCWPQALSVYAYAWGVLPLALANADKIHSEKVQWALVIAILCLPFVLRFFSRRRS